MAPLIIKLMLQRVSIKEIWSNAWHSDVRRRQLITGFSLLLIVLFIMPVFFRFIEKRKGVVLHDWLLNLVPPHNVSGLIFSIMWGMALFVLYRAVYKPEIVINYCWTLLFVSIMRFISISLVPLAPPVGFIQIHDPITGIFYGEASITKDLFFSGHTATIAIMVLCLQKRTDKIIALIALISVACLLLIQHIHYSIDILCAPLVVYTVNRLRIYMLYKKPVIKHLNIAYARQKKYSA